MIEPLASETALPLSEVVAATGLSADVLRAWQRRYGFPQPLRDRSGRRVFTADQVARLRMLRRLVDRGVRPAHIVALPVAALEQRLKACGGADAPPLLGFDPDVETALACLAEYRADSLIDHLQRCLVRRGTREFVLHVALPLVAETGAAWHAGRLAIHQEHFVSEILMRLLGNAALNARPGAFSGQPSPVIVLTTCPGEAHGLGLAMLEGMLAHEGCRCINLGLQTPHKEVGAAARAYGAAAVALSFSLFFKPAKVLPAITEQRGVLPENVALWVGGGCAGLEAPMPAGVTRFKHLGQAAQAVSGLAA